jgi:hypothetical protein
MTFDLFWIDCFMEDKLWGFGLFSFQGAEEPKSLLSFYWKEDCLTIYLFWFRFEGEICH